MNSVLPVSGRILFPVGSNTQLPVRPIHPIPSLPTDPLHIASLPVPPSLRSSPLSVGFVFHLRSHRKLLANRKLHPTGSGSAAMKLLTHNLLTSHVRGLQPGAGFPFHIRASEVRVRSVPFNAAFVARLLPRLHWEALLSAAESVSGNGGG
ncbi:multifunctional methyltransferase subunit TRM112-like protein, partial [Lagopus leucura]